jgi:electron transport complex protein RnfG
VQTFKALDDGTFAPLTKGDKAKDVVHGAFAKDGKLVGVALEASGMGYQDNVFVLVGYAPERDVIVGMEILESRETPGIGDRAEKDPGYRANFKQLDVALNADGSALAHPIEVVKPGKKKGPWQIDTISGATITSRAVGKMVGVSAARWVPRVKRAAAGFKAPVQVEGAAE